MTKATAECYFTDCRRPATIRIWMGDDASGREVGVCARCRKERFDDE